MKRSSLSGTTPTLNTASTIDNTWLATDIAVGELFANVEDDRVFIRMNNGLFEFNVGPTGTTVFNFCSTGLVVSSISGCSPITLFDNAVDVGHFTVSGTTINNAGSNFGSNLSNSVVIGGGSITANDSNTVYVPTLKILTASTVVVDNDFSLFINSADTVVKERRNLIANQYFYTEDDSTSSTTSGIPQLKLGLTATTKAGNFRLMAGYECGNSATNGTVECTTRLNGIIINTSTKEPKTSGEFLSSSAFKNSTLSAGTNIVEIFFAKSTGAGTSSIRNARIELMRID